MVFSWNLFQIPQISTHIKLFLLFLFWIPSQALGTNVHISFCSVAMFFTQWEIATCISIKWNSIVKRLWRKARKLTPVGAFQSLLTINCPWESYTLKIETTGSRTVLFNSRLPLLMILGLVSLSMLMCSLMPTTHGSLGLSIRCDALHMGFAWMNPSSLKQWFSKCSPWTSFLWLQTCRHLSEPPKL